MLDPVIHSDPTNPNEYDNSLAARVSLLGRYNFEVDSSPKPSSRHLLIQKDIQFLNSQLDESDKCNVQFDSLPEAPVWIRNKQVISWFVKLKEVKLNKVIQGDIAFAVLDAEQQPDEPVLLQIML